MKQFIISFITKSGVTVLNLVVEAKTWSDAIEEVKEDAQLIISCVTSK